MSRDSRTCRRGGKPLKEYESECEAQAAAAYLDSEHSIDREPYLCPECGRWHLGYKDRIPYGYCDSCTDSCGKRKQLYYSREDAEKMAAVRRRCAGVNLRVYECRSDLGWHLSKARRCRARAELTAQLSIYQY